MTSDPALLRRVARLENDRDAIYDLLTDLRTTQDSHTETLASHTETLAAHTERFDRIDATLAEVLRRLPES